MSDESLEVVNTEIETDVIKTEEKIEVDTTKESALAKDENKEGTTESNTETELSEVDKVKSAMQKRIDRLTAKAKQAEENALRIQQQYESIAPKQVDDSPKIEDFETQEQYEEAKIEHRAQKLLESKQREALEKQRTESQAKAMQAAQTRFSAMEQEFVEANPDYFEKAKYFESLSQEVLSVKGNTPTTQAIGQVLIESDVAPALIHYLAQNEDFVYELADKTPVQAAFELFKLQQKLTSDQVKQPQKPEPIKSLKSGGKINKGIDDMNADEVFERFSKRK